MKFLLTPCSLHCFNVLAFLYSFPSARLVGGGSPNEGLIQVNYNKTWGWVCADQWDKQDADVACRMMGFAGSLSAFEEKEESKETKYSAWLNDMQCTGNERSLFSCVHGRLKPRKCEKRLRAGATCRPKGTKETHVKPCSLKYLYFFYSLPKFICITSR